MYPLPALCQHLPQSRRQQNLKKPDRCYRTDHRCPLRGRLERIRLTEQADTHLQIRPGTNVAFANGMIHIIINEGLADSAFIEQFTDYPGYQKVDNDEVREKFEKAWGVKLNPTPGLKATDVFPAAINGKIKGLYICGEDPIVSDPDTTHIEETLKSLDFLVIQDLFLIKTAEYADVILPAVSYAEKEGTILSVLSKRKRGIPLRYPTWHDHPDKPHLS